jgi:hypothetical protein
MFRRRAEAQDRAHHAIEESEEVESGEHFAGREQECHEWIAVRRPRAELHARALARDLDAVVEARHDEQRQHRGHHGAADDRHRHR